MFHPKRVSNQFVKPIILIIMKLFKLLDQLERSLMSGSKSYNRSSNWTRIKAAYNKNKQQDFEVHSLNIMTLRERNGSRGEGIGMGHRNKPIRTN